MVPLVRLQSFLHCLELCVPANGCLRGDRYWRAKVFLDFHRLGIHTRFAACVNSPNAARFSSSALARELNALQLVGQASACLPFGVPDPVLHASSAIELYMCGRIAKRAGRRLPNRLFFDLWKTGIREPVMLTKMTEEDWEIVLEVFDAGQSERANPDTTIVSSWRHCITLRCTASRGGPCQPSLASGTASGSGSGGSAARVCSRHSCSSWRRPARARR